MLGKDKIQIVSLSSSLLDNGTDSVYCIGIRSFFFHPIF